MASERSVLGRLVGLIEFDWLGDDGSGATVTVKGAMAANRGKRRVRRKSGRLQDLRPPHSTVQPVSQQQEAGMAALHIDMISPTAAYSLLLLLSHLKH